MFIIWKCGICNCKINYRAVFLRDAASEKFLGGVLDFGGVCIDFWNIFMHS